MVNQKRRKCSVMLSFLIPVKLLEAVNAAVNQQQKNTRKAPLNRSEWIRRAIERDLEHAERSRKGVTYSVTIM